MGVELSQALALGVGAGGALVQIDDKLVRYEAGVDHLEGRSDGFRPDTPPGTVGFTLDNYDGRFTPDNTAGAVAASYSVALSEGSAVCWSRGGKLWAGKVRAFDPSDDWGLIRISCDDLLGDAARVSVPSLADQLDGLIAGWSFGDVAGSSQAAPVVGNAPMLIDSSAGSGSVTFGAAASFPIAGTVVALTAGATGSPVLCAGAMPNFAYSANSLGSWGFWVQASAGSRGQMTFNYSSTNTSDLSQVVITLNTTSPIALDVRNTSGFGTTGTASGPILTADQRYYVSFNLTSSTSGGNTTYTGELRVDGVSYGSRTLTPPTPVPQRTDRAVTSITIIQTSLATSGATYLLAHLYHSPAPLTEPFQLGVIESTRIQQIAALVPQITLDTLPTLPTRLGILDGSFTALDGWNGVMETEQGYIYVSVSGTLTAPVPVLTFRERTRPPSSTITGNNTFDAITEINDLPRFVRDLTYTVTTFTATGPSGNTGTYTDPTLTTRVGAASDSAQIAADDPVDLFGWASDRVVRGGQIQLRAISVEIDALTTPTDRSTDLLALKQGDRIRVANIPSGPTGFTTWDGWIIGIKEHHSATSETFEFMVVPCLPDTAIYDTNRYMAGGNLSLGTTITAGATSVSIVSSDGTLFTTSAGDFPLNIKIDNETMTLSGVSGSSSPQTGTVSARGVNGTTATSHTSTALVDLATDSLYAF